MKLVLKNIIFVLFVKVIPVYSECDSFFGCIKDTVFGSFINLNATETQVGDVDVPDFDNVNLESDSVDSILKHISNLFEDFVADYNSGSQFKVIRENGNKTSILVKAIETDNFHETYDEGIKDKNSSIIRYSNTTNFLITAKGNNEATTKEHLQSVKIGGKNKTQNIKLQTEHNPVLDVDELSKKVVENEILDLDSIYYDFHDNSTDYPIIDYIDLYKDTTNEDVNMKTTVFISQLDEISRIQTTTVDSYINDERNNRVYTEDNTNTTDIENNIFSWVTAIFIKNYTSHQFDYYCDGALLSDEIVLTAASCIQKPNATTDDILVILGKRSLRDMTENEIVSKIKEVHIHDNFTGSNHDIAILVMEDPVTLSDHIQRARLGGDRGKSATTGWAVSGYLTLIPFEKESIHCNEALPENTFCAEYGNDVSVCPSFGGVFGTKQKDGWFLRGIRTANPMHKGFCVNRSLIYTDLKYYSDWISAYVK